MQYDANTPDDYIKGLEEDWRKETLLTLRDMLLNAGVLDEGIKYKMLSYGKDDNIPFQLNAQKNYVSLYVGNAEKVDPDGSLLQGIDVGKGCIRFKKTLDPKTTRINEFINKATDMWQKGADMDC